MVSAIFFRLLFAILSATTALSADLWTCTGISASRRTVGYYDTNYAGTDCGQYPETLIVAGHTHINAAYAWIDPANYTIAYMTETDDAIWRRLTALKQTNPGLQLVRPEGELQTTKRQGQFAKSLLSVMEEYGFDGVDFDWSYPVAGYAAFLYNMRKIFQATGYSYGLSATLPQSELLQRSFDIDRMQHTVDWFNVKTYDIDTATGKQLRAHSNLTEFEIALTKLWEKNVDPAKVTLGLAFYGRSYTVESTKFCPSTGCIATGLTASGFCDDSPGYLSYDQVLSLIEDDAASPTHDDDAAIKWIAYEDNKQWIYYDDKETFAQKVDFANKHCIGGLNIWAIDLDGKSSAIKALSASTKRLTDTILPPPDPTDPLPECQWSECTDPSKTCFGQGIGGPRGTGFCQGGCPAGLSESWRSYGIDTCGSSTQFRMFCCPATGRPDRCRDRQDVQRFETQCVGRCSGSEVKIGTNAIGCFSGWNEICCTRTDALASMQQCAWTTTCSTQPQCPKGKPNQVARSVWGDGGLPCFGGSQKLLCCSDPNPYDECKWEKGPWGTSDCQGICSAPYITVAASTEDCARGQQVLCCFRKDGDDAVSNAKDVLYEFLDHQTCPAPADDADSTIESRSASTIEGRDSLSNFPEYDGVRAWTQVMLGLSDFSGKMRRAWDTSVGRANLRSSQIKALIEERPWEDPVNIIEQTICDFEGALGIWHKAEETATSLCQFAWNSSEPNTPDLDKRIFRPDLDATEPKTGSNPRINTGALIRRITDTNDVPFLYSRVLGWTNHYPYDPATGLRLTLANGDLASRREANLEVAYDLRQVPELQQTPGRDIFAVFHFHIPFMVQYDADPTVDLHPAISYAHVYHGHRVILDQHRTGGVNTPNEWRVDHKSPLSTRPGATRPPPNTPEATERTEILECGPNSYWYPGVEGARGHEHLLTRFGARLRDEGIFGTRTLHNWRVDTQEWHWAPRRERDNLDWPNTGRVNPATGDQQPPSPMNPNAGPYPSRTTQARKWKGGQ